MWRLTPVRCIIFRLPTEYSVVMYGASDLTVASSQYDILLCSETFVSDMRYVSELLVLRFFYSVFLCLGRSEGWLHTYERDTEHFGNPI